MATLDEDLTELTTRGEDLVIDSECGVAPVKGNALASNFSGTRLVAGSLDGAVTCIDFYKWKNNSFGPLWTATLDQAINSVAINLDETVVAACSGNRVSFYTDAGDFLVATTKGDMYLLDSKKTRGHIAATTCVAADPNVCNHFASTSIDGTVRIFDVNAPREGVAMSVGSKSIFLPRASRGAKSPLHSLCYFNTSGKSQIAAGSANGNIISWDVRSSMVANSIQTAHLSAITCLVALDDGKLVSRAGDVVKLWDLRSSKEALNECEIPGGDYGYTMATSPNGKCVAVAKVVPINPKNIKEGFKGGVEFLASSNLAPLHSYKAKCAPGPIAWANGTEQLFMLGLDGNLYVKTKGDVVEGAMYVAKAKVAYARRTQADSIVDVSAKVVAYAIDDLPDNLEEADDGSLKRKRQAKVYKKPGAKQEPEIDPVTQGRTPINYKDDDIVARLRSMAAEDQGDASVTDAAADAGGIKRVPYKVDKLLKMYKQTQPDVILDFSAPATREENLLLGAEKCPRCGLKICQCGFMAMRQKQEKR